MVYILIFQMHGLVMNDDKCVRHDIPVRQIWEGEDHPTIVVVGDFDPLGEGGDALHRGLFVVRLPGYIISRGREPSTAVESTPVQIGGKFTIHDHGQEITLVSWLPGTQVTIVGADIVYPAAWRLVSVFVELIPPSSPSRKRSTAGLDYGTCVRDWVRGNTLYEQPGRNRC
jgi:hypothetical protein